MEEVEKSLDSRLWHACAGGMVQMPPVNTKVFYFPQGHAEQALTNVDFGALPRLPALVLCRVAEVKFMADPETDEVYAKVRLVPVGSDDPDCSDDEILGSNGAESPGKPDSFAKTLTQSDANNGGGFSVPRYCAETIFPPLDYSAEPPVQTVVVKDVHGEIWRFRHIYRGTPRRHLLTTGWSTFVNQKKLVAGDSIIFVRAEYGVLCVGIRRAKRGITVGPESPSGWNSPSGNRVSPYGPFSVFLKEGENKLTRSASNGNVSPGGSLRGRGILRPEAVIEAASLAANGQPFEVVYYARASTPEFCVKATSVRTSMRIQWCSGMRFKMPFETEDSSRISWFMGTIASVQVADPLRWPHSPWRLLQLQVTWDEPDLLLNVKRVNPWLVELVSNMPIIQLSPFSPPRKKLRSLHHPNFPLDGQFLIPSFLGNPPGPSSPFRCPSDNIPAGIQGARHAQFGRPLLDLHLSNKLQLGLFSSSLQQVDPRAKISDGLISSHKNGNDNISCLLSMGNSNSMLEKTEDVKTPQFVLFGQKILTEQQITRSCFSDAVSEVLTGKSSSEGTPEDAKRSAFDPQGIPENISCAGFAQGQGCHMTELGLDTGHCNVFMESEDVGRTLDLSVVDLSVVGSYKELYKRLANMLGIERSDTLCHVLYQDATGAVKKTGDEPFSDFMKSAKRLTILLDSGSTNVKRNWITGLGNDENGLDSSNQTGGRLTIFA